MADEYIVKEDKWEISYFLDIGEIANKYFVELRDNGRIMATKCPRCKRVFSPPRSYCERCFVSLKEHLVELPVTGTLNAFTIVTDEYRVPDMPEQPYVIALVKLDGASTSIAQLLKGVDLANLEKAAAQLKPGLRVKAVFKPAGQRQGRIQDFYFELVSEVFAPSGSV